MPNPLITKDATETVLAIFTPPPNADSFAVWDFNVIATSGTNLAAWTIRVAAKYVGGAVALVDGIVVIAHHASVGASTWVIDADTNSGTVRLLVTGAVATQITWALVGERQMMSGGGSQPAWTETTS